MSTLLIYSCDMINEIGLVWECGMKIPKQSDFCARHCTAVVAIWDFMEKDVSFCLFSTKWHYKNEQVTIKKSYKMLPEMQKKIIFQNLLAFRGFFGEKCFWKMVMTGIKQEPYPPKGVHAIPSPSFNSPKGIIGLCSMLEWVLMVLALIINHIQLSHKLL